MEKLIITVATTGAITTREHTPYLPITVDEIVSEIYGSWKAGAAIAHIHTRDARGKPCMDYDQFKEIVMLVREKCDIIINLTSSGGLNLSDEERIRPLSGLNTEMASFDAGSMNFYGSVFLNPPDFLEKLAGAMLEKNVKPEIEVFEMGMIDNAMRLFKKGMIRKPLHFQFVLGVQGGMAATPKNLLHLVESIPSGSTWSVTGCGRGHLPISTMAIHMGGHVRVGMEDNIYLYRGVLAKSNVEFVKRIVDLAALFERAVATPDEARRILRIAR